MDTESASQDLEAFAKYTSLPPNLSDEPQESDRQLLILYDLPDMPADLQSISMM
jgi:hypothetical protein